MLKIPREIYEDMIAHVRSFPAIEICGILAGRGDTVEKIYRGTNIEFSPTSYQFPPQEQFFIQKDIRNRCLQMLAVYHSHPEGRAYMSPKDKELAVWDVVYVVIGLGLPEPEVKGFLVSEGEVKEEEIQIII
jgi:proteasome lid subunit RPN8/RPN11